MKKRITALFTAIVMIAVIVPASFATEETSDYDVLFYNGGSTWSRPANSTATGGVLDTTTFTDAYPYGSVMKMDLTSGANEVMLFPAALDTSNLGKNEYLYFGMDIKSGCSASSQYMSIRLSDGTVRFNFQFRPETTGYLWGTTGSSGSEVASVTKIGNNWVNLGFVIQLTDSTGAVSGKVMSVSYNGINQPMPSSDWVIASDGVIPGLDRIAFYSKAANGTYMDNFEVIRYSAADGVCPVTTRYEMRTSIDTYEAQYNGYITDGVAESELAAVKTAIDEAKSLYNSESLTQTECTAALSKIAELIAPFGTYKTVLYENFNSLTAVPENITTSTGYSAIAATGNYFFKDAVKFSSTSGETNWPAHKIDFDDISLASENTYVEAEFDVKPFNLANNTRDFTIVLGGENSARMWALRFFSDGTVDVYNDKDSLRVQQKVSEFSVSDWNHIKIVLKTVKTDDTVSRQVDSVFINGEEVQIDDANKSFFYDSEALAYITFKTNKNEGYSYEFGGYMDNISVRTYTSADGTSPLSDRYSIIGAAQEFCDVRAAIDASADKRGYTDEEIAVLDAAITKLCNYSEYAVLTASQTADINTTKAEVYALLEKNAVREVIEEDFEGTTNIFNASTQENAGSVTGKAAVLENSDLSYSSASAVAVTDDLNKLIQWEFDVMVENPASGSVKLALQSAGENVEAIEIADSAITMTYNGSFRGASAEAGKWYRIRIVTSAQEAASGNTAIIEKLNINGNDHLVTSTITRSLGDKTQIDSIKLSATEGAKAYIDNVSLKMYYTDTEAPVNKGALVDYIRRGKAALAKANIDVNMLQSIYDNYAAAVTAAEVVYNNETATQDAVYTATDTLCTAASKYIFKEESVKIGAVEFTDASGNAVVAAANGVYIDKINITRKAAYGDGSILIAVYNNGVLEQIKVLKDVIGTLTVGERTALEVDMLLGDFTHIKAFAFDSLGKLSPIAMPYSPTNEAADVYVAGDSIVQSYIDTESKSYYPRQGWGYYLQDYFEDVTVDNLAVSGYTTVSYISNGKLNIAEETMNEGDYLLVSFMANDNNKMTASQFKNMLRYYNDVAELHGATAVFITSPKTAYEHQGEYNGFCTAMRDVASELDVALIDVYDKREKFEEETSLAYVQSSMYLFNLEENFDMTESQIQANLGSDVLNGKDKTHLSEWGAERVASWIAELLQDTDSTLRYYKNDKVYTEPDAYVPSAG